MKSVHSDYSRSYGQPLSTGGGFNSCETYYDSKLKQDDVIRVSRLEVLEQFLGFSYLKRVFIVHRVGAILNHLRNFIIIPQVKRYAYFTRRRIKNILDSDCSICRNAEQKASRVFLSQKSHSTASQWSNHGALE